MIYGLIVSPDGARHGSVGMLVHLDWPVFPASGQLWTCCRRQPDIEPAVVSSVILGGGPLDNEDAAQCWVTMTAGPRLIGHLIAEHGFFSMT
jgi:hypothetical protein